jgi:hypothetical protein
MITMIGTGSTNVAGFNRSKGSKPSAVATDNPQNNKLSEIMTLFKFKNVINKPIGLTAHSSTLLNKQNSERNKKP